MSPIDPEEIEVEKPLNEGAKKVVDFFAGEAHPDFEKEVELEKLAEFYRSMKETEKEVQKRLAEVRDEIFKRVEADKLDGKERKKSVQAGPRTIIVTKRRASIEIKWRDYVTAMIGKAEADKLEQDKKLLAEDKIHETEYVKKKGDDSLMLEVV